MTRGGRKRLAARALAWAIVVAVAVGGAGEAAARTSLAVGSKRFTESYVLAEMAAALLETGGDADVRHVEGLGGTAIVFRALEEGSIDLYPEYTGTLAEAVLHLGPKASRERIEAALAERGLALSPGLGFENRYALAVRDANPRTTSIRATSALAPRTDLTFVLSPEFLGREDGWPALARAYGLSAAPRSVDHALAYEAMRRGTADVTDVYTTDAALARLGLRVLEDDHHVSPSYEAVIVYRAASRARAPRAFAALGALSGALDERTMAGLNGEAEASPDAFRTVARTFVAERLHGAAESAGPPDAGPPDVGPPRPAPRAPAPAPAPAPALRRSFVLGVLEAIRRYGPQHVTLVAASVAAATLVGIPLGVLGHRRRRIGAAILAVAGVVQTIPSLALLCFFLPIAGIGAAPSLAALFLYALFPIVQGTLLGLDGIPAALREATLLLALRGPTRLFAVELPLASRSILAGIKTSVVLAIGTATLAAFVGAGGFGQPISMGLNLNDTALILEGAVPAAGLALLAQAAFALVERWLVPRGLRLEARRDVARP